MAKHECGSLGNPTTKYPHVLKTTCKITAQESTRCRYVCVASTSI